ncbi:MAG: ATP-grasp domain-containing protein [Proteobacteria bacterium]|nr:MAG: ATP-grasp domain-containing protein [Pseudomonadota bacterium]
MSKRVLVTAGRLPAALEICRALAKTGATVISADSHPAHICQGSRSVSKSYHIASPRFNFARYREEILDIVKRERIDLIVPASEDVFHLARLAPELKEHCEVFFPETDLLFAVHHKQKFIEMAAGLGLAVPQSMLYEDEGKIPDYCQKDYILKQVFSRAGQGVIFAKAGVHPKDYGALADGSWLLQEKLAGETLCSCTIVHNGKVGAHLVYRPSVILGSVGVVFRQIDDKAIRLWVEKFVAATGYHGMISMDFILNAEGEVAAIECNPRPTSGVHLFEPAMMGYAIQDPTRPLPALSQRQKAQITLGMLGALPSVFRSQKNFKQKIFDIAGARDVMFSWRDPGPALYQLICYGYLFYLSWTRKISLTACMMDGVEWNGEEAQVVV